MQKTVIFSKTDKAGVNIASLLEKEYGIAAFECGEGNPDTSTMDTHCRRHACASSHHAINQCRGRRR